MSISSQLEGHLDLTCAARADGVSYLSDQSVRAPFHLSKPYWDGHALVVQSVNVTAGVFSGDRLACRVRVGPGARMMLTSPSAHRIHTMSAGEAVMDQSFEVASGGWLDVFPELFIPQAGCRYRQRTEIRVEEGGELFFVETMAPGRVARGERFAFDRLTWRLNVEYAGELILRESFTLKPGDESLWSLQRTTRGYYASCLVVSSRLQELSFDFEGAWVGVTRLAVGGYAVKIMAADSTLLRGALRALRAKLVDFFPALAVDARKL